MAKRSDYKRLKPLDEHETFEELKKVNSERAGLQAEMEGHKSRYDAAMKEVEAREKRIHKILRACNEDLKLYFLKSGDVTTEEPDKQMEFDQD